MSLTTSSYYRNFVIGTEEIFSSCELGLNRLDWIPYISELSGNLRILVAAVECAAGAVLILYHTLFALMKESVEEFRKGEQGLNWCVHGVSNCGRGIIAATLPFGCLVLLVYDALIGRFYFRGEKEIKGVYRLNDLPLKGFPYCLKNPFAGAHAGQE